MYLISTTLLVLTVACSSGHKDNKTTEEGQVPEKRTRPMVAVNQSPEIQLMMESMADAQVLAKSSAYSSKQQRVRQFTPPTIKNKNYQHYSENGIKSVLHQPVSTFSIDVDTGSYTNIRRMINQGIMPPADAIRIEEFINYFDYDYSQKIDKTLEAPFSIDTAIATSPWAEERHIMRIGLKGFSPDLNNITGRNLVFLLDVSGSMGQPNKLPLLTRSLALLTAQLSEQDRVSIVVYAGASGVVLEPTQGDQKAKIKQALLSLSAGGSTNGQRGY